MKKKHLFIVGAGRSGTTFLWRILNNSQQIHLCTEIHYFSWIYHNGFLKNYRKWKKCREIITPRELYKCLTLLKHFGMYWQKNPYFEKEEIDKFFQDKKIEEKSVYEFLLSHDLELSNKENEKIKYVGEKTPVNVFHLRELLSWFPNATVLFIFRDPIKVLKSEANKTMKPDYPMTRSNPFYHIGIVIFVYLEWLLAGLIAIHQAKERKEKLIIVSYERLISSKHEMVRELSDRLGITFDEELYAVKKIDSSYSGKSEKKYWEPSIFTKFLFSTLSPLYDRLKSCSIL